MNIDMNTHYITDCLDIRCNFTNFKYGLIQRLVDNYEDTEERQQAINKIVNSRLYQAINFNYFCADVLPVLWHASPPQNEKFYCPDAHSVSVRIMCANCDDAKELKVRSYFYGNLKGSAIKGAMNIDEFNSIEKDGIDNVIKKTAAREVFEEVGFQLTFNPDDDNCNISLFDTDIDCKYSMEIFIPNKFNAIKHCITIKMACRKYDAMKNIMAMNYFKQKKFLENTGEISGIVL